MIRLRYFIETLPSHPDLHHPSQASAVGSMGSTRLDWIRLDNNTIMGWAELPPPAFSSLLISHPTVTVLPSVHDSVAIKKHCIDYGKPEHYNALAAYCGAIASDALMDIIGKMILKGHTFLHPDV